MTVQEAPWRTPLATAFVEAGMEMGYENRDGNGEYQSGFMVAQGTIRRGSRCSAAKVDRNIMHFMLLNRPLNIRTHNFQRNCSKLLLPR